MTNQKHLDMATMDMLQDVLEDGFTGLLETFISDSAERIDCLRAGMANSDADMVRRSAHSLKGSSSNLGANVMAELSVQIEERARDNELSDLVPLVEQLETEFEAVARAMQEML